MRNIEATHALTPLQEGILFHTLLKPDAGVYVVQWSCDLEGRLDPAALKRAWEAVTRAHTIFRTGFVWERKDQPIQVVFSKADLPWTQMDWRDAAEAQTQKFSIWLAADRTLGFDLRQPPLMRLALIQLSDQRHRLVWTSHHLILDGWSTALVLDQVIRAYTAQEAGENLVLPPARPFADYVRWIQRQDSVAAEAFWRGQVACLKETTPVPFSGTFRASDQRTREFKSRLSPMLVEACQPFVRRESITLNTLLLGAWLLLLRRLLGQQDLCTGLTLSGRPADLAGVEEMVGLFINTVPLVIHIDGLESISRCLRNLQERVVQCQRFHYISPTVLRPWTQLQPDAALFSHLFVFENTPGASEPPFASIKVGLPEAVEATEYPFTLVVTPESGISVKCLAADPLLDTWQVEEILRCYQQIVAQMVQYPERRVCELELLDPEATGKLLGAWSGVRAPYPAEASIADLFEQQNRAHPAFPALQERDVVLTYEQLDEAAATVAAHLQGRSVRRGDLVGIAVERGWQFIAVILGVLKCGAAFVPLDRRHPHERLRFMARQSGCCMVIVPASEDTVYSVPSVSVADLFEPCPVHARKVPTTALDLAYVMFTSGSTGEPKAIAVPHRAVVRLVSNTNYVDFKPGLRIAQASSIAFDASTLEIWGALLNGGTLVILELEALLSADERPLVQSHQIDLLWLTAGLLHQCVREQPRLFSGLPWLLAGGDVLDPAAIRDLQGKDGPRHLVNGYGPTENTTFSATYEIPLSIWGCESVPIGRPIANSTCYLLDEYLHPVPPGAVGELWVGGDGLAYGYWGRPDLTAERFYPNPFAQNPGERLYRTGDRARWLPSGDLEFLGRQDQQLKIRGFRVETEEIEQALLRCPGVQSAAVIAMKRGAGDVDLAAFVLGEGHGSEDQLKRQCQQWLPDYMVPRTVRFLESFPLTENGKLDRQALRGLMQASIPAAGDIDRIESSDGFQSLIAGIWSDILQVQDITPDSDFFALGGHSLSAMQVVSRVRSACQVVLPLRTLFNASRLGAFADQVRLLRSHQRLADVPLRKSAWGDTAPVSFAQQRLWFLHRFAPLSAAYHIPHAIRLQGRVDIKALELALETLVQRHEALRTVFLESDGVPHQKVLPYDGLKLVFEDYAEPAEASLSRVEQRIKEESERAFDLSEGPLYRMLLMRLASDDHVLFINLHHIVADGWSVGILVKEMAAVYRAQVEGTPPALRELPVRYLDFAAWQRVRLQGEYLREQMEFWRRELEDAQPLDLPTDFPRPVSQDYQGGILPFEFSPGLSQSVMAFCRKEDLTPFMTLLSAFACLLARYTGQTSFVIGTPIANRNHEAIENLIGFFVNMLVLRFSLEDQPTFREVAKACRRTALAAYDHQDVPFEMLVEQLQPERDPSRHPFFQVTCAFHNMPMEDLVLPGLKLVPVKDELHWVRYELEVHFWQKADRIEGYWAFKSGLFEPSTIQRLHEHYVRLLESAVQSPGARLSELPCLSNAERQELLVSRNQTAKAFASFQPVHRLFDEQAQGTPNRVAVRCSQATLTYAELRRQSDSLGVFLSGCGVGRESLVGIFCERSLEMVTAILGVLKAGAAYVPLDPDYPSERITLMVRQSGLAAILTQSRLQGRLAPTALPVIDLDQPGVWNHLGSREIQVFPDNLAYGIFTSGSTGTPKAVLVPHRALTNHMAWMQDQFPFSPNDRVLQKTVFSFDASVWEFFAPLLAGGELVMAQPGEQANPDYLVGTIRSFGITVLQMVPSVLELLVQHAGFGGLRSLRRLFVGGEALSWSLVERVRQALATDVVNLYGPAEATIDSTFSVCEPNARSRTTPIGRAIANVQTYVLDRFLSPVPAGVPGELYLGGEALARGYCHQPELTADRFLPHPFGGQPGERLYRTGDLARILPNGEMEYLGRTDRQVKIRGLRIELDEIRAQLQALPQVRNAAVVMREDAAGQSQLAAYAVLEPSALTATSKEEQLAETQLAQWESLYQEVYAPEPEAEKTGPDFTGWTSSYTGEPIPAEEMNGWLEETRARLRQLKPRRVLEIGCGTGMILFGLAPQTEVYYASDFSEPVVAQLRRQLTRQALAQVELHCCRAHQLEWLESQSVDTVILNSVVQYFPGLDYFLKVLSEAIRVVKPGGAIFLGDIRNFELLECYHASVQFFKASDGMSKQRLLFRTQSQARQEEELLLSPGLFHQLKDRFLRLGDVRIQLKRGATRNELVKFRYDVVLTLDSTLEPLPFTDVVPPPGDRLSLENVRQNLLSTSAPALLWRDIPNARLTHDCYVWEWLNGNDHRCATVGQLRKALHEIPPAGLDPEAVYQLAAECGFRADLSWSRLGFYDAALIRQDGGLPAKRPLEMKRSAEVPVLDLGRFANDPLRAKRESQVIPLLREELKQRLPIYMVPQSITLLEALPLTVNGKLDIALLPEPGAVRGDAAFEPPRNSIERALAEIWQGILGLGRIGIHDEFFALGGHSLLTVMLASTIRQRLNIGIPVSHLFQLPTISQQANYLQERERYQQQHRERFGMFLNEPGNPVVFCFPPLMGYGIAFQRLAQQVHTHSLYAFDFTEQPETVPVYLEAIRALQSVGPYIFLGYSAGGALAFAVTQALEREGQSVSDLVLMDCALVEHRVPMDFRQRAQLIQENLDYFKDYVIEDANLKLSLTNPYISAQIADKMHAYLLFLDHLDISGVIRANLHLIASQGALWKPEDCRPWEQATKGFVRRFMGAGTHTDMTFPAYASENATIVQTILSSLPFKELPAEAHAR
jgi:amino acid adenylation domain-containing protein